MTDKGILLLSQYYGIDAHVVYLRTVESPKTPALQISCVNYFFFFYYGFLRY